MEVPVVEEMKPLKPDTAIRVSDMRLSTRSSMMFGNDEPCMTGFEDNIFEMGNLDSPQKF